MAASREMQGWMARWGTSSREAVGRVWEMGEYMWRWRGIADGYFGVCPCISFPICESEMYTPHKTRFIGNNNEWRNQIMNRANRKSANVLNMLSKHTTNAGAVLLCITSADPLQFLCHFHDIQLYLR